MGLQPLYQARRIEARHTVVAGQLVGEGTLGQLACLMAQRDDLPDQRVGLGGVELAPADPADLTVVLVGAEQSIRLAQKVKRRLHTKGHGG